MPTYDDALELLHAWTESASLRRHAYAVEAAMEAYAEHFGADVTSWRVAGLLHDLDYEKHPDPSEHPFVGVAELERLGYPADIREAILGHAEYSGTPRTTEMARALFAVDELSGFVTAAALVRPTGIEGMQAASVRKKLKDKAFAAAVSRDDIYRGADELGVDLDVHITRIIAAQQRHADRIFGNHG